MGAGGERCVFAASHRADLPLLLARPVLALLGEDLRAVLVSRRSHAEPLAVLDRDLLTTELARPGAVAEFGRRAAWSGRGVPSHSMSGSSPQFWHTPHSLNSGHCVAQSASVVHFRSHASVSMPSSGKSSCVGLTMTRGNLEATLKLHRPSSTCGGPRRPLGWSRAHACCGGSTRGARARSAPPSRRERLSRTTPKRRRPRRV